MRREESHEHRDQARLPLLLLLLFLLLLPTLFPFSFHPAWVFAVKKKNPSGFLATTPVTFILTNPSSLILLSIFLSHRNDKDIPTVPLIIALTESL